jgi:PBP1b-binding outer membrane lipoprotein LpoB
MRMCKILLPFLFLAALLVGCTAQVTDSVESARQGIDRVTAAGAQAIGQVKSAAADVQQRADNVREGVSKIVEGKALIDKGLKGK